jgi:hypothetical protein
MTLVTEWASDYGSISRNLQGMRAFAHTDRLLPMAGAYDIYGLQGRRQTLGYSQPCLSQVS